MRKARAALVLFALGSWERGGLLSGGVICTCCILGCNGNHPFTSYPSIYRPFIQRTLPFPRYHEKKETNRDHTFKVYLLLLGYLSTQISGMTCRPHLRENTIFFCYKVLHSDGSPLLCSRFQDPLSKNQAEGVCWFETVAS